MKEAANLGGLASFSTDVVPGFAGPVFGQGFRRAFVP
jgi:hypothetical protein